MPSRLHTGSFYLCLDKKLQADSGSSYDFFYNLLIRLVHHEHCFQPVSHLELQLPILGLVSAS